MPNSETYSSIREDKMTTSLNKRIVKLILPSTIGYERIAMSSLASFAAMYDFPPARIEDLKTVVAEAAINAMQHGNQWRPDTEVHIRFNFFDDAIQIYVSDEGEGINEVLPQPDIDRIVNQLDPPVGFGIYLIQELTDEVEFNAADGNGHCLKMVIKK
jgi:serine/threonine-protein kinase RsbW